MATNPMQKKSRISFLLGMLLMLIIAAVVIAMMFMKMKTQQEEIAKYKPTLDSKNVKGNAIEVYILNTDVKSGQILVLDEESNMFRKEKVYKSLIPSNATTDIYTMFENAKILDTLDRKINPPSSTKNYYYYVFEGQEGDAIIYKEGEKDPATTLQAGDKCYYIDKNNQKQSIEIAKVDTVVAKIDMKANTIITNSAIVASNEKITDDLRKVEYNVINLPVDLAPNEYIDVRLTLPNGQNYIVVSKKSVTIPVVDGAYISDTIQMNLTEEEILNLSCAIYENYKMKGSKLEAVRYIEAGSQKAAYETYQPSKYVYTLIRNNPNIVNDAIKNIADRRLKDIDDALNKYEDEGDLSSKVDASNASTLEQRKAYLQTLVPTT